MFEKEKETEITWITSFRPCLQNVQAHSNYFVQITNLMVGLDWSFFKGEIRPWRVNIWNQKLLEKHFWSWSFNMVHKITDENFFDPMVLIKSFKFWFLGPGFKNLFKKWSYTYRQFVANYEQLIWVCLSSFWGC